MTNFNVILLSFQQREVKQKCTLQHLHVFFRIIEYGCIEERKKAKKTKMKKNLSHQYVHFHIIVFNGNLFFFEMFFEIYNDYRLLFSYYYSKHKILLQISKIILKKSFHKDYLKEINLVWSHIRLFLNSFLMKPCFFVA